MMGSLQFAVSSLRKETNNFSVVTTGSLLVWPLPQVSWQPSRSLDFFSFGLFQGSFVADTTNDPWKLYMTLRVKQAGRPRTKPRQHD